jgi:uncharacterized membrane protein YhaH (DUF805 family)
MIASGRLGSLSPRLRRAVPAGAVLFFLAWCYVSVRPDFSWDDAEPEILNQAWRLAQGEALYRGIQTPPFVFAAYTPIYYALVGLLLKFTGLSFLPAKLVSFLSALSIGSALALLSRRWHGRTWEGLWSAFFLFLIPAFLYNAARSHAQMMAVALSLWSLVFFLRQRRLETVVISPILAVLAFYTKQTQVALPVAMAVYLLFRNRRWLLPYLATAVIAGTVPLLWLQETTGGYFLYDTVQLAKLAYDARQIVPVFLHHAGPLFLFMAAAALAFLQRIRGRRWEPIDFYFVSAMLLTLVSLGRLGAHGQYVLELLVVTMAYLLRTFGSLPLRRKDLLVSLQILFLFIYTPFFIFVEEGLRDMACNRAAAKIYPLLRQGSGPILSQQGSFALFARGEIHIQLFHFTALFRAGVWDQKVLLNEIGEHTFSWVITEFPIEDPVWTADDRERFTPEMAEALRRNYRRDRAFYPYYLYRPRAQREPEREGATRIHTDDIIPTSEEALEHGRTSG